MAKKNYYNMHSRQEEFLYKFIEQVGCMSFWQAKYVLMEFYRCNDAQATRVVLSLGNKKYFRFVDGQKYLCANSLMDNSKMDRDIILAISAAFEKCSATREVESITADSTPDHQLSMIADNTLYYVLKLPEKDYLPKIFLAQQNYTQAAKIIMGREKKEVFGYTTLFVFPSGADIDETLETVGALDLTMPHEIYFAKEGELYEEIQFERFAEDAEEEDPEEAAED